MTQSINLRNWIGREESTTDAISASPIAALSATLDRDDPPPGPGDALPPLWHWLFFLARPMARDLGPDGHPKLGGFVPPVGLPRRMWAGSRIAFDDAPRVGDTVKRRSRIDDVKEKNGASGRLVFITVRHDISTQRGPAIREYHDIVYRDAPPPGGNAARPAAEAPPASEFSRVVTPDPVLLFRYSALTFNSHRIHYDLPYVTGVEGYPGLIVHGPLIATLLLDLLRRHRPDATVTAFDFRALSPLFHMAPFSVHGRAESATRFSLWAVDPQGRMTMQASADIA